MEPENPRKNQVLPLKIQNLASQSGIDLLGICSADWSSVNTVLEEKYHRWLQQGRQGDMDYLSRHQNLKYQPTALLKGAKSILVFAMNYYQKADWENGQLIAPLKDALSTGRISRYAWGRDYHKGFKKRLISLSRQMQEIWPMEESRAFVDSGPLHERLAADASGIAFTGKNTLSISHDLGSWFFLGVILTTADLPPTGEIRDPESGPSHPQGRCPSGCSRCIDVCPTGALEAPYRINGSRCISYLTIEHKGLIEPQLMNLMGDWIFGCDLCQEVCPFNIRAKASGVQDFTVHRAGDRISLLEILNMESDQEFLDRFAGSPVMRSGRESMVRNALIAAANSFHEGLIPRIEALAQQTNSMVIQATAKWALGKIIQKS